MSSRSSRMRFNSLVTRLALSVPTLMRSFSSCLRDHALYLRVGLGLALVGRSLLANPFSVIVRGNRVATMTGVLWCNDAARITTSRAVCGDYHFIVAPSSHNE